MHRSIAPCAQLGAKTIGRPVGWNGVTLWLRMSQMVQGFGRLPFRRWAMRRGRRSKASQGGNRGEVGDRLASATMGI
jgi:hypothetical protein